MLDDLNLRHTHLVAATVPAHILAVVALAAAVVGHPLLTAGAAAGVVATVAWCWALARYVGRRVDELADGGPSDTLLLATEPAAVAAAWTSISAPAPMALGHVAGDSQPDAAAENAIGSGTGGTRGSGWSGSGAGGTGGTNDSTPSAAVAEQAEAPGSLALTTLLRPVAAVADRSGSSDHRSPRSRRARRLIVETSRAQRLLLEWQMERIERLADAPEDQRLALLLDVDHAGHRLQRSVRSLSVLLGDPPAPNRGDELSMADVLHLAVSQSTAYTEVSLGGIEPGVLPADRGRDLAHLVAELIDHATGSTPTDRPRAWGDQPTGDGTETSPTLVVTERRPIEGYIITIDPARPTDGDLAAAPDDGPDEDQLPHRLAERVGATFSVSPTGDRITVRVIGLEPPAAIGPGADTDVAAGHADATVDHDAAGNGDDAEHAPVGAFGPWPQRDRKAGPASAPVAPEVGAVIAQYRDGLHQAIDGVDQPACRVDTADNHPGS